MLQAVWSMDTQRGLTSMVCAVQTLLLRRVSKASSSRTEAKDIAYAAGTSSRSTADDALMLPRHPRLLI